MRPPNRNGEIVLIGTRANVTARLGALLSKTTWRWL
jgi:hypothetical protein